MTAARSTLGDGRASTTKASRTNAAAGARQRSPIRSQPQTTSAAARTTATLVPDKVSEEGGLLPCYSDPFQRNSSLCARIESIIAVRHMAATSKPSM